MSQNLKNFIFAIIFIVVVVALFDFAITSVFAKATALTESILAWRI